MAASGAQRTGRRAGAESASGASRTDGPGAGSDTARALVERLAGHRTLGSLPRPELEWLAEHGEQRSLPVGAILSVAGTPIDHLWIVLAGRLDIRVHRGPGWRRVMEWRAGDVSGVLPFSRMLAAPGETRIVEATEVLAVHRCHFPEMIRECQELTATLVHVMLDRARHFRSSDLQDEKLASLGRLAAGLAHELNNPASAAARNAGVLAERLPDVESAFLALGARRLAPSELAAFEVLCRECLGSQRFLALSPLARAERREELGQWLESHGLDRAGAEALAETDLSLLRLDEATRVLDDEALGVALVALAASCEARRLSADLERAAGRVHELVAAVKGFTYMDQASVPKPVDLARGIADTLAVHASKAKSRSVHLVAEVEPDLPHVNGFGGELNQVWANLVDNAIDAVASGGSVRVSARREADAVVVRVVDDGPGVPPELVGRIFEPFYTTKPVGEGTGLGLAIARSLVGQHEGEIELTSRPGHTEFRVTLPVAQK
jgi:signal transduction histidine kinase